jgi:uncharacterized protein YciI
MGLLARGGLAHGGPFLDDAGGIMVTRLSAPDAEAFASEDPCVRSGVLAFAVRPWLDAMGAMTLRVGKDD